MNKSVWIEKLPGGYSVRHRGAGREWFATYEEARKRRSLLQQKLLALRQGVADPTRTIKETFAAYLDDAGRSVGKPWRPETLQFKKEKMAHFLTYKEKLIELDESNLPLYHKQLLARGLALSTIKMTLTEIRAFLNWCVKERFLTENPFKIKIETVDVPRRKIPLSDLLALEKNLDKRFLPYYYLLMEHGTRRGETLKACGSDINLKDRTWFIPGRNSKGKKDRTLPLGPQSVKVLSQEPLPQGLLFPGWNKTTPRYYLNKARKLTEKQLGRSLGKIFPHLFRHTRASNWRGNQYAMMAYMGWSSAEMGKLYSHPDIEDLRREADRE